MTNKKQINLRIKEEVHEKLKIEAKKEGRTVNNLIEKLIDDYLRKDTKDQP